MNIKRSRKRTLKMCHEIVNSCLAVKFQDPVSVLLTSSDGLMGKEGLLHVCELGAHGQVVAKYQKYQQNPAVYTTQIPYVGQHVDKLRQRLSGSKAFNFSFVPFRGATEV